MADGSRTATSEIEAEAAAAEAAREAKAEILQRVKLLLSNPRRRSEDHFATHFVDLLWLRACG